MKYATILLVLTLGIFFSFLFFSKTKEPGPTATIRNHTFILELAQTPQEKAKGLASRTKLSENKGMLFLFQNAGMYTFWMKDTLIPLDMIFINDKRIVTIHKNVKPQPNTADNQLQLYPSKEPVNYVLEINAGLSDKYGFKEGDVVTYENLGN